MKKNRLVATAASVLVGAFALAACTTPDPGATVAPTPTAGADNNDNNAGAGTETPAHQAVTIAMTNTPNGLNGIIPNAANNQVVYLTQGPGFAFFDGNLNYVRNTDFGTFDVVSEDPEANTRTVKYTINPGVTWSDGTPVDAADMILAWATSNNRFVPDGAEWSWAGPSTSMGTVSSFPIISDDGRSITFTYDDMRSDWYFQFGSSTVPAHIVARRALGIQDPTEAKQALISAFGGPENYQAQTGTETPDVTTTLSTTAGPITTFTAPNIEQIAAIQQVHDNDWFFNSMPSDPDLTISQGPFQVVEWQEGEFMRLERNPNFNWYGSVVGRPNVDEITIRFIGDAMAQVMALQNGEVDVMGQQATPDVLAAVQNLTNAGINYTPRDEAGYEHVTLMMNNGGPFDPAHWGGNAETARLVRQAFLFTIPREEIVERLIQPLDPNAEVRNSLTQAPGAPAYNAITAGNRSTEFNVQDIARARQLLEEAGVTDQLPIPVRLLYANNNPRRSDQFELIRAAAQQDGLFEVIDNGSPDWGTILRSEDGSFDAALFAWLSTSTSPNNSESNFITGGLNNIGGFSDPEVDQLWSQITRETDENRVTELTTQMERRLFEEGFGAPIFQFPGLLAWRDTLHNVSSIPLGMQQLWNYWQWNVAG